MMPVSAPVHRLQRGFTLVELMVAITVGLFLTGGLVLMMQSNRRAFSSQNQLSQLQDNERMATNMITDMVQIAGYFPDPTTYTATSTMTAISTPMTLAAGQFMYGVHTSATAPDTLTVRFASKSGDGILNCSGTSNGTGSPQQYVNTFSVDASNNLNCTMGLGGAAGTVYPLVAGVHNMQILYGIDTTGGAYNINEYLTADQVTTASAWNKVISVQISLTFVNPLYDTTKPNNPGQTQYLPALMRTATIMNAIGL